LAAAPGTSGTRTIIQLISLLYDAMKALSDTVRDMKQTKRKERKACWNGDLHNPGDRILSATTFD
jgi:hypothetical protein